MGDNGSFGDWLKRRRQLLDLTREELARRVSCSVETIRKIEREERRPSREIAARLATLLEIAPEARADFVRRARGDTATQLPRADGSPIRDDRPRTNLPAPASGLVGRQREVAQACALLLEPGVRLLTMTGTGGTGKTRLGLQVASTLLPHFADGVWFVPLAALDDPRLVIAAIAGVLDISETGGQRLYERVRAYLRAKQLLLVLDNFEHVLQARSSISELLAGAAGLKVLVTSRAMLHLYGEHEFAVPPLALPQSRQQHTVGELAASEAVALFVERARAATPDFKLTARNGTAVAEICQRLDGLPLAIELAAARCKALPIQALRDRLSSRMALLTDGAQDLPARQRTLRNTIDWSFNLLTPHEQRLFARLAVFAGGWMEEAATAVCNAERDPPADILDGLQSLRDKSLIGQQLLELTDVDADLRFTMLETIREYALERLAESGEEVALRREHAAYFLQLAERAEQEWNTPNEPRWISRLEVDHDNFRAALGWSLDGGDAETGVRLAGRLAFLWDLRGVYDREALHWLERAARHAGASAPARARVLAWLSRLKDVWGDGDAAERCAAEAVGLARSGGDKHVLADALAFAGTAAANAADYARAEPYYDESLKLYRELGDNRALAGTLGTAGVLGCLASLALAQGQLDRATRLAEDVLASRRLAGNADGVARTLNTLGEIARERRDLARATELFEESLAVARTTANSAGLCAQLFNLGFVTLGRDAPDKAEGYFREGLALAHVMGAPVVIVLGVIGMAGAINADGTRESALHAARLMGFAWAQLEREDYILCKTDRDDLDRIVSGVRAQLDEAAFRAAWADGQVMTPDEAVAYALAGDPQRTLV